jgi:hypothetical protein
MTQRFEDKLLVELKTVVAENARDAAAVTQLPARRRARGRVALAGIAAVVATAVAVVVPAVGGRGGLQPAYAVTENDDGTVTVKIYSIRDERGLERQIEEKAGIPASVHYLPRDKMCAPPWLEDRLAGRRHTAGFGREHPMTHELRGKVRLSEAKDGAFVFTIDRDIPDGWSLVVTAQDDVPEHGQHEATVPSIAAGFEKGESLDDCRLVDGSMEGWGFQQGAPPTTDEQKQEDFEEYRRRHADGK